MHNYIQPNPPLNEQEKQQVEYFKSLVESQDPSELATSRDYLEEGAPEDDIARLEALQGVVPLFVAQAVPAFFAFFIEFLFRRVRYMEVIQHIRPHSLFLVSTPQSIKKLLSVINAEGDPSPSAARITDQGIYTGDGFFIPILVMKHVVLDIPIIFRVLNVEEIRQFETYPYVKDAHILKVRNEEGHLLASAQLHDTHIFYDDRGVLHIAFLDDFAGEIIFIDNIPSKINVGRRTSNVTSFEVFSDEEITTLIRTLEEKSQRIKNQRKKDFPNLQIGMPDRIMVERYTEALEQRMKEKDS